MLLEIAYKPSATNTRPATFVVNFVLSVLDSIGRSDRIRTYDPLIPNQMRYQAALRSAELMIIVEWLMRRQFFECPVSIYGVLHPHLHPYPRT